MILDDLLKKINDRSALIGIVGLGYVGLPLMLRYSEVGYRVLGVDIDAEKVARLNKGESYIEHISASAIAVARNKGLSTAAVGRFVASADQPPPWITLRHASPTATENWRVVQ